MFYNDDGSVLLRKDTKANWTSVNPVLEDGELVIEVDGTTRKLKCGDGVTKYTSLPYISAGGYDSVIADMQNEIAALQTTVNGIMPKFTFTKNISFAVNTWFDVGINGGNLQSGVYIMHFYPTSTVSLQLWSEHFTGLLYWYNGGTNSPNATNITLHYSGHANNSTQIQARTQRSANNAAVPYLRLQLCSNIALEAKDWVFEFKKIF